MDLNIILDSWGPTVGLALAYIALVVREPSKALRVGFLAVGATAVGVGVYASYLDRVADDKRDQRQRMIVRVIDRRFDRLLPDLRAGIVADLAAAKAQDAARDQVQVALQDKAGLQDDIEVKLATPHPSPKPKPKPKPPSLKVRALTLSEEIVTLMEDFYKRVRPYKNQVSVSPEYEKEWQATKARYMSKLQARTVRTFKEVIAALPEEDRELPYYYRDAFEPSPVGQQATDPGEPFEIIDVGEWLRAVASKLDRPTSK